MLKKISLALTALPKIFKARLGCTLNKPCIGVAISDHWPDRFEVRRLPYDLALARAGASVVTFRPDDFSELDHILDPINGLVLAGGEDVHPVYYGGDRNRAGRVNRERDELELALLEKASEKGLPVLCICRGAQLLSVWAGGSLESHDENTRMMTMHFSTFRRLARHRVSLTPHTKLFDILGNEPIRVNSFHHQTIVDPGALVVSAVTVKGGIEGVELPGDRFVVGVQWHPELQAFYKPRQQALFSALVKAARDYSKRV